MARVSAQTDSLAETHFRLQQQLHAGRVRRCVGELPMNRKSREASPERLRPRGCDFRGFEPWGGRCGGEGQVFLRVPLIALSRTWATGDGSAQGHDSCRVLLGGSTWN